MNGFALGRKIQDLFLAVLFIGAILFIVYTYGNNNNDDNVNDENEIPKSAEYVEAFSKPEAEYALYFYSETCIHC